MSSTSTSSASASATSSSLDSEKETDRQRRIRKGGRLDPGDRAVEKRVAEKQAVVVDEGRSREKKGSEITRKEEKTEERRPKRERDEPAGRRGDRYGERRFREVKERETSRERRDKVRERDIKERESSRERRDRESPRELKERDFSRDFSRNRRPSDRWRGDDQDQERGSGRGRGRRFSGSGRLSWTGRYNGNDGRYNDSYSRQGWKDVDRDSSSRRRRNSFGEGEKWKHDMFESIADEPKITEPEEDPIAKIEALLAS
ncbi:unnamed protein product [Calypogeia fissa]